MIAVLAAAAVATAVASLLPGRPSLPEPELASTEAPERSVLRRLRPLLALVAAAGGWAALGGWIGAAAGVGAAVLVWVVIGRGDDPAVVRRRELLAADLPLGVDLLAGCLEAGAAPAQALTTVGRAVGGPVAEEFLGLHHRLHIGVDPVRAWLSLGEEPALAPLGRAVARAQESGASVSLAVRHLAAELRERQHAEVEQRARTIEVRAAAPLGVCLLPAFVLLGVVPLVAGVFGSMRIFG